ncbi:MAG: DUF308 domain-containing protein [Anaerolineaceae bacterium]|nr:DUF308 domain-containing protein [Anaerolineaceae bacterium]
MYTKQMIDNWWLVLLRGSLISLFGLSILIKPMIAALTFVVLFGSFAIMNALIFLTSFMIGLRKRFLWWIEFILAILFFIIGLIILRWPEVTLFLVVQLFSVLILLSGVANLVTSQQMRKSIQKDRGSLITGIIKIIFALSLVLIPEASLGVLIWGIGGFTVALGINEIVYAFRVRNLKKILSL